ncbi:NUDIX domain-containing protein [Aliiruegeria lutimaris]|uniref:Phosphohistidine phosphatase n=1 Tax=Aliiruegeria lutimaris TaxID=571298 RepID=A0A1G8VU19_9RHOB|nr:NUDIX domain-containing protein [Aliiruegeria lutimaris]SDJ69353.1 phosphohistidine phosphatase [Aliiruegeria lutimaris]
MTRELLLLRNGKAEATPPRELKDGGKRQVQRVGVWLQSQGLLPDHVRAAPSERAKVSAQKALKAGGASAGIIAKDARLKSRALTDVLACLADIPVEARRPMIVAHRKLLERLARHLSGDARLCLPTGTLLRLALPDDWTSLPAGCAEILELLHPESLPERFPFPGPGGPEWRDRPAYYYRQSAVIPWRLEGDALRILVITSSKRSHWVVPKGIHEPGLSAQASAAHEAEEEAGVLGEVGEAPLGEFTVEKWGGVCRVSVYPMRVTEIFDQETWEESHRSRLWVSPEEALQHLKHDGLKEIVRRFADAFSAR